MLELFYITYQSEQKQTWAYISVGVNNMIWVVIKKIELMLQVLFHSTNLIKYLISFLPYY